MSSIEILDMTNNNSYSKESLGKSLNKVYSELKDELDIDVIDAIKSSFGLAISLSTDDTRVRVKADELIDTMTSMRYEERYLVKEYIRLASCNKELLESVFKEVFKEEDADELLEAIRNNISLGQMESFISKTIQVSGLKSRYNDQDIFIMFSDVVGSNMYLQKKIGSVKDGFYIKFIYKGIKLELPMCGNM